MVLQPTRKPMPSQGRKPNNLQVEPPSYLKSLMPINGAIQQLPLKPGGQQNPVHLPMQGGQTLQPRPMTPQQPSPGKSLQNPIISQPIKGTPINTFSAAATSSSPQKGWGIGYGDDNVGGGFSGYNDKSALTQELARMQAVIQNRSKQGLGNTAQNDYLTKLNSSMSALPKEGWGVGYGTPNGGKAIDYNDPQAVATEIERMNTVIKNRQAQGMDNIDNIKYLQNLQGMGQQSQQPTQSAPQNPWDTALSQMTTTKQLEEMYGFDYSREYAKKQAEAEAQALRNANADAGRRNTSNKQENMKAIDNNLMNMADGLDRNYFLQALQQQQGQINSGMNGGVAADQDLRLAMSRQANMGDAYRDANLGKMQENNRYTNEDMRLAEQMGLINQQGLAREDSLFNERLQQALQNGLAVDGMKGQIAGQNYQQQMDLIKMMEDSRRFDMNFGLEEAEVTGNYLPSYMRGNPFNNPFSGGNLSGVLSQYGIQGASGGNNADMSSGYSQMTGLPMNSNTNLFQEALRQKQIMESGTPGEKQAASKVLNELSTMMAAQGIDPSLLGGGFTLQQSQANMSRLNPTMNKVNADREFALKEGELTGYYKNPDIQKIVNDLLTVKGNAAKAGKATPEQVKQADAYRSQLSALGVNPSLFAGGVTYQDALKNAGKIGNQTLGRYQTDLDAKLKREEMNNDRGMFDSELNYKYDSLDKEYTFKYAEMEVDRKLQERGYTIDEMRAEADSVRVQMDMDERDAMKNTQYYITQIMRAKTKEEAYEYIAENGEEMATKGVFVDEVINSILDKFPSANTEYVQGQINERTKQDDEESWIPNSKK